MSVPDRILQFVADVEDYYGTYPPKIKIGVLDVLKLHDGWPSAEYLDQLYDVLTDSFSTKWRTVPSKVEIREAMATLAQKPSDTGIEDPVMAAWADRRLELISEERFQEILREHLGERPQIADGTQKGAGGAA